MISNHRVLNEMNVCCGWGRRFNPDIKLSYFYFAASNTHPLEKMKSVYDFLESPLVVWVKTNLRINTIFSSGFLSKIFSWTKKAKSILNLSKLDYDKFPNGEYFHMLLKQSDPRIQNSNSDLPNEGEPYDTTRSRLLNLDFILRNIRSFYQVNKVFFFFL